jgi:hypothetical protein
MKRQLTLIGLPLLFIMLLWQVTAAAEGVEPQAYIPLLMSSEPPIPETMVEFRGLWVTRFD